MKKNRTGFTLIELLIVVAIIGILAAIAIPNFLGAQVRSKVARIQADMTTVRTALEMYYIDHTAYPPGPPPFPPFGEVRTYLLTTPLSYITSIPMDIFNVDPDPNPPGGPFAIPGPYLGYLSDSDYYEMDRHWLLLSFGPDQHGPDYDVNEHGQLEAVYYDPSNGTVSRGDIYLTGTLK